MGKFVKRPNRPGAIALTLIALMLAATAYIIVSLNRSEVPTDAGPPPSPSLPAPSTQPAVNTAAFPATPPAATGCAHPVSLQQATGAWMAGYNDDKENTGEIPSGASQFGLLDFDWLTVTTPTELTQSDQFDEPLSTVLSDDVAANPCTLRFVTINDTTTSKTVMAEILTRPAVMEEHVAAIAEEMASLPDATGLTLDYESALPYSQADLATYAQVAGWHNLTYEEEVNDVTLDYDRFVQMVAAAMHKQDRLLRVATLVRNNDMVDSEPGNIAPYVFDYGQLAKYADQIVLMAVDFHYAGGAPGPITPLANVIQVAKYVHSYGMPLSKVAIEEVDYSYDWEVNSQGGNATNASGQVIDATQLTPTQVAAEMTANTGTWRRLGTQDGEAEYGYTVTSASGHTVRHIVWDAATGMSYEKAQLAKALPGVAIDIWQIGNNDPLGSTLAANVK